MLLMTGFVLQGHTQYIVYSYAMFYSEYYSKVVLLGILFKIPYK